MSDESLFREVDEEVRQEQYKKIWDRYGNVFVALCLAIVLGVAAFKGWQYWQRKQAETAAVTYFQAVSDGEAGKAEDALKAFETVSHSGYAQLSKIQEAGILAAAGKTADAVKLYDSIAASDGTAATLRDLARVRAAFALIDTAPAADIAARLKGFDVAGNPWQHVARELMMLAAFNAKDVAGADLQAQAIIADPESPAAQKQRAQIIADLLLPLKDKK